MATDLKSNARDVSLTRFYGGQDRGSCVQVTTTARSDGKWFDSVQLTRAQAAALAADLMDFAQGREEPDYEGDCDCYGCVTMRKPCIKEVA